MKPVPTIGVLAPLLAGEYFGTVLEGIRRTVAGAGGRVIAIQTLDAKLGDEHQQDSEFTSQAGWDRIDGIVTVINAVSLDYLTAIRAVGKPVVMISHEVAGFDCPRVVPDNTGGARAAVAHLLEHGHTAIAFVGNRRQQDIQARWEAYCAVLRENGIEPDPALTYDSVTNMEHGGVRAGHQMLAAGLPSSAVFVATDYSALGLMKVLKAAGLELPRDQAIVGFDDTLSGAHHSPALSSVSTRFLAAGGTAAELVLALVAGQPVANGVHEIPTELMARESCGCNSIRSFRSASAGAFGSAADGVLARLIAPLGVAPDPALANRMRVAGAELADSLQRAADGQPAAAGTVAAIIAEIVSLNPSRENLVAVVGAAQEAGRGLVAMRGHDAVVAERVDAYLLELTLATMETQLRSEYATNSLLRNTLRDEYDVSLALLQRDQHDPRELSWLSGTIAAAGCVAMWAGADAGPGRQLRIAGSYDRRTDLPSLVGETFAERTFPPASMLEQTDGGSEVVFVLPLRTATRDWGLFAAVGPIGTSTSAGRETYYQWAALLSVALDHEAVLESLNQQRENVAAAYERERGFVESIRVSEERYALAARAVNDGLWDWDMVTGAIFYSARWRQMLGYADEPMRGLPDEWFDRVHPDDLPGLLEAIQARVGGEIESFEYEHRMRGRDGVYRWMLCRALAVPGPGHATTRMVGSLADVTERKELEDRLRQGALYDGLTGLPNRTLFLDRLGRAIARSKRRADYGFLVLFLDLDGFKIVNDSLGHLAGDLLLVQVADRIRAQLRDSDTAARFGGDEFAVLLNDVVDLGVVPVIVDRLQAALSQPYVLEGTEVVVSASIGVAASTTGYDAPEDVLRDSDIAMYRAKSNERGTYATFDVSMHEGAVQRMRVESELRRAIDNREFELHYQPIVDLGTRRIEALEALVRWRLPDGALVPPGEFLPVAEETGLMVPVGRLIVEQACQQLASWRAAGLPVGDVRVSVNVSNREFWHSDFTAHLTRALAAAGARPEWLNLEITEGVIMHNPEAAQKLLTELRAMGFALHVDDFGTGYSSLDALHRFPVEALKIDQSFVARLETDARSRELVRTIIMMGDNLKMEVIAEGIETVAQEGILRDLGCTSGQGYLYSRPLPAAKIVEQLIGLPSSLRPIGGR